MLISYGWHFSFIVIDAVNLFVHLNFFFAENKQKSQKVNFLVFLIKEIVKKGMYTRQTQDGHGRPETPYPAFVVAILFNTTMSQGSFYIVLYKKFYFINNSTIIMRTIWNYHLEKMYPIRNTVLVLLFCC